MQTPMVGAGRAALASTVPNPPWTAGMVMAEREPSDVATRVFDPAMDAEGRHCKPWTARTRGMR